MRPGRAADHSPHSSAAVMEEYSYTSTQPVGHTEPVTGTLYLQNIMHKCVYVTTSFLCVINSIQYIVHCYLCV